MMPGDWSAPQYLLVALVLTIVITGGVAASTSQTAFGSYNAAWDGASDLRDLAADAGADPVVALNTTEYESVDPDGTVAIVLSPDEPYTLAERTRVSEFVDAGGTLVVAEDYGPHSAGILRALGVQTRIVGVPLRDEQEYYRSPAFAVATNVTEDPVTAGVDQLTLNHGTSLRANDSNPNTTVLVRSSEFAYLDRNRDGHLNDSEELASHPVVVREAVGNGTVYVVSDPSLFINAMLERPGNARFTRNLVGNHSTAMLDYSHLSGQPPLVLATLTLQRSPLWQVVAAGVGLGGILFVGRLRGLLSTVLERLRRRGRPESNHEFVLVDPDDVVQYLARRHPEWDEARLRRVMRGVLRADESGQDND